MNNMENSLSILTTKLASITEAGIERQLNQSIFYSPFRLFYRLFKKKNPQLIQQIRELLANDIQNELLSLENWDQEIFIKKGGHLSAEGNLLIKRCYNIGIRLVKKLSVKMAFRALRDRSLQQELYGYILDQTKEKTITILKSF